MRNGLWTKEFGIAMILLFLVVSVLPNINGNVVNLNTPADSINKSTMQEKHTIIFIGIIKDMVKIDDNRYQFKFVRAFAWHFLNVEYTGFYNIQGYKYYLIDFTFETKIGFIRNHVICGVFTYYSPEYILILRYLLGFH